MYLVLDPSILTILGVPATKTCFAHKSNFHVQALLGIMRTFYNMLRIIKMVAWGHRKCVKLELSVELLEQHFRTTIGHC